MLRTWLLAACLPLLSCVAATAPTPSPLPSAATTSPPRATTATPSPTAGVLDDGFGFVVSDGALKVRSETSDAAISSFTFPRGRSFTSLSRVISPDGRFLAYWDPVDSGAVLHVRSVTSSETRAVLTRPGLSGNAFGWSSDSGGLVAALDNNCFEICGGQQVSELWTVDLPSGATEKIASGSIWLPVTWDRAGKVVAAGVTGSGGYLIGYDIIDLRTPPYAVRSTPFRPTIQGRLQASSDARSILLVSSNGQGSNSLAWWPLTQPEQRTALAFDGAVAQWRPRTAEIWWAGSLNPPGCESAPCAATALIAVDITTGVRRVISGDTYGGALVGFRVDGSAALTEDPGMLIVVDVGNGATARTALSGRFVGAVRLR